MQFGVVWRDGVNTRKGKGNGAALTSGERWAKKSPLAGAGSWINGFQRGRSYKLRRFRHIVQATY